MKIRLQSIYHVAYAKFQCEHEPNSVLMFLPHHTLHVPRSEQGPAREQDRCGVVFADAGTAMKIRHHVIMIVSLEQHALFSGRQRHDSTD